MSKSKENLFSDASNKIDNNHTKTSVNGADLRIGERGALIRIHPRTNQGVTAVRLSDRVWVTFNRLQDRKTMIGVMSDHARNHGGKILIPFTSSLSVKSLTICSRFFVYSKGCGCLTGTLVKCGEDWSKDKPILDSRYTVPWELTMRHANRWVMLDDIKLIPDTSFLEDWRLDNFPGSKPDSVAQALDKGTKTPAMLIHYMPQQQKQKKGKHQ